MRATLTSAILYFSALSPVLAGNVQLVPGVFQIETSSYLEQKYSNVIRQEKDYSCGAAAVATLFTYQLEIPVTEEEFLTKMEKKSLTGQELLDNFKNISDEIHKMLNALGKKTDEEIDRDELTKSLDEANIEHTQSMAIIDFIAEKTDISMKDIKDFITQKTEYKLVITDYIKLADKIREHDPSLKSASDAELRKKEILKIIKQYPVMVRISPKESTNVLGHFTIVKKLADNCSGNYIYLADPTQGNIAKSVDEFISEWDVKDTLGQRNANILIIKHKNNSSPLSINCSES